MMQPRPKVTLIISAWLCGSSTTVESCNARAAWASTFRPWALGGGRGQAVIATSCSHKCAAQAPGKQACCASVVLSATAGRQLAVGV